MAFGDTRADPFKLAEEHVERVDRFRGLLVGLAKRSGGLADLEGVWATERPFGGAAWRTVRGPYGETVLHWIRFLKAINACEDNSLVETCVKLGNDIVKAAPELAAVACHTAPYKGCTVLHQACADGDVDFVRCLAEVPLVRRVGLDAGMETALVHTLNRPPLVDALKVVSCPQPGDGRAMTESPLEVAVLAPENDTDSMEIVKILLKAGAKPVITDASGKVSYTLLHVVARGRWQGDGPFDVSEERTKVLVDFLMGPAPSGGGCIVDPAIKNSNGQTPLQVAASLGNDIMFVEMLDMMKRPAWVWGNAVAVSFPIDEIESNADANDNGALELMALYRRTNLLDLGLVDSLIHDKWDRFGRTLFLAMLSFELAVLVCTAIYCIDSTPGWSPRRWYCRNFVVCATSYYLFGVGYLCFKNGTFQDSWTRSLSWKPFDPVTLNVWSIMVFRQCCQFFVMVLLAFSTPHRYMGREDNSHLESDSLYIYAWHICTSIWWVMLSTHVLNYFLLFESTAGLAVAVPRILIKDMLPFSLVFVTMLMFVGVALRIAVAHTVSDADPIMGSIWKVFLTLEESIHGPDVRWRTLVEGRTEDMIINNQHPEVNTVLPGFIFVGFLWLSLMMMSIILALFSARYDELRLGNHAKSFFKLEQAVFTMVAEKLLPVKAASTKVLTSQHGYGATCNAAQLSGAADAKRASPAAAIRDDADAGATPRPPAVVSRSTRWFLWQSGSGSHDGWRQPRFEMGHGDDEGP